MLHAEIFDLFNINFTLREEYMMLIEMENDRLIIDGY